MKILTKHPLKKKFFEKICRGTTTASACTTPNYTAVAAGVAANIVSTAITYDAYMDYREIENPQPSDDARLILNLVNYGIILYFTGWTIPAAIIGVMDVRGDFDSFYEQFNK